MGCSAFCADDVGRAWASMRWPLSKANRQNAVTYRMASPLNENVSPFSFCMATLSEKDNWRTQAMSQACAVCSPVSWDFERNGDITPIITRESPCGVGLPRESAHNRGEFVSRMFIRIIPETALIFAILAYYGTAQ